MKKPTLQERQIDHRIEQAYYATCQGIAVSVMDIGKIFDYGRCVETGITDMELQDKIYQFVVDLNSKANDYNSDLKLRIRDGQVGSGMKHRN